jgi:hypothetical protein
MLSQQDIRRVLGRLDDAQVVEILKLSPTLGDVEIAAICLAGDHDVLAKSAHHTSGIAEGIVAIVSDGAEYPSPRT